MGARQSKRVEISSASKKGDVENGAIVGTEEKLEKIEEGETVVSSKSNANGSTTTSSTVTAEQQETTTTNTEVAAAPETSPSKELESKSETITDVAATEKSINEEAISPSDADDSKQEVISPASPSEATTTGEGASSTEKKKKPKKKFSFRFSFSKKDKQKPVTVREEQKQQETLKEANEAVSPSETQNKDDSEKKTQEEDEKKKDEQAPPPLPTSPPPTPAEEIAVVAPPTAPVEAVPAVPAVPEKEETLNISDGDVEVSGGGEALAEPLLEDGELLDDLIKTPTTVSEPAVASNGTVSLTNGEVKLNGDVKTETENGTTSPVCELKTPVVAVENLAAKIDALKLHISTDNTETPAQNGFAEHSVNGDLNGTDVNGGSECQLPSDSVVSVDVNADVSADN